MSRSLTSMILLLYMHGIIIIHVWYYYYYRTTLSSEEITELYNSGNQAEADETTNIKFIPHHQFVDNNIELLRSQAPSAQGCFLLYLDYLRHSSADAEAGGCWHSRTINSLGRSTYIPEYIYMYGTTKIYKSVKFLLLEANYYHTIPDKSFHYDNLNHTIFAYIWHMNSLPNCWLLYLTGFCFHWLLEEVRQAHKYNIYCLHKIITAIFLPSLTCIY